MLQCACLRDNSHRDLSLYPYIRCKDLDAGRSNSLHSRECLHSCRHFGIKLTVLHCVQGKVTEQTLRQLFDEALSTTFPHLLTPGVKPCLSVAMHSEGRYAFVELATPEMATAALQLSGQLNFLGSQMTVGRPSGYIDPQKAAAAAAAASKALQEFTSDGDVGQVLAVGEAPPLASQPTQCLCIDHMVGVSVFTDEEEYQVWCTYLYWALGVSAICVAICCHMWRLSLTRSQ